MNVRFGASLIKSGRGSLSRAMIASTSSLFEKRSISMAPTYPAPPVIKSRCLVFGAKVEAGTTIGSGIIETNGSVSIESAEIVFLAFGAAFDNACFEAILGVRGIVERIIAASEDL